MAEHNVQSPLPGTFYRKASPDAPPYAEVGQAVEAGSVIGLIEVMKQFSEVQAGRHTPGVPRGRWRGHRAGPGAGGDRQRYLRRMPCTSD
ncbi:hypothetical protein Q012_04063 [Pseudomonas aeruginosa S35004]|nr:hypothetical protein Q012_04063 [Pseudomonas aeruginosa S35004]